MRKTLLLFAVLSLAGSLWAADPIIGTWKMNIEKSKFPEWFPAAKECTVIYREVGPDQIEMTFSTSNRDGTSNLDICTYPAQGGAMVCRQEGSAKMEGVSLFQMFVGPGEWYALYIQNGKQVGTRHKVVSKDGKTTRDTMKAPEYMGKPLEAIWIMEKQ